MTVMLSLYFVRYSRETDVRGGDPQQPRTRTNWPRYKFQLEKCRIFRRCASALVEGRRHLPQEPRVCVALLLQPVESSLESSLSAPASKPGGSRSCRQRKENGKGRRHRRPPHHHPSPIPRCCNGRGGLGPKSLSVAATESRRGDRRVARDLPEQALLLLATSAPEQRGHAHGIPGLEPPVPALLQRRRAEQVDPVVGSRRRLAPVRAAPAPDVPPRQGVADTAVPDAVLLVRPPGLPQRRRQPHVRVGLRVPPGVHGLARRRVVARFLRALRPRHRQEQAEPVLPERRGRDHGRRGDRGVGLRVRQAARRHGEAVRARVRPGRAGVGAPRPHIRALGARLRQSPQPALVPRGAGAAGGRVALRVRIHLGGARRRRGLPGDAARGGAVRARRRGRVRECDGVDGGHVPAGRPWRHRRAVPGVHRPGGRAERRQGAPDERRRRDLVP